MAIFRQIHCRIWKDGWFLDLSPTEKLLFVYLFSNELASVSGIYELPVRVMAFETGLDVGDVRAILDRFATDGKVFVDGNLVWVVNLRRYNESASPKVKVRIDKDVEGLPDCDLKVRYLAYYSPDDTVSIPYSTRSSETETETETETDTDTDTDIEKETDTEMESLFLSLGGKLVPAQVSMLLAGVEKYGIDLVSDVARKWVQKGYNPGNVDGILSVVEKGWERAKKTDGYRTDGKAYLAGGNADFVKS